MLGEIDSFVNWLRRRNQEARTWRDYAYDLHQFAQVVGDRPPGSVTFHDVDRFVMQQAARGFQPATINRRLAAISALYTFLADDDQTLVCPVLPHRRAIKERERLPRPVQADQVASFLTVVDHSRDLSMFLLMLRSGLRISEVAALRLCDLYLDERHPASSPTARAARSAPPASPHGPSTPCAPTLPCAPVSPATPSS